MALHWIQGPSWFKATSLTSPSIPSLLILLHQHGPPYASSNTSTMFVPWGFCTSFTLCGLGCSFPLMSVCLSSSLYPELCAYVLSLEALLDHPI